MGAEDHHIRRCFQILDPDTLTGVKCQIVIGIQEHNDLAVSLTDTGVAGRRKSAVGLIHDFDTIVNLCKLLQNSQGIIRTAIIDTDELYIIQSLIDTTGQAGAQTLFNIIDRNNHRYFYRKIFHLPALPNSFLKKSLTVYTKPCSRRQARPPRILPLKERSFSGATGAG